MCTGVRRVLLYCYIKNLILSVIVLVIDLCIPCPKNFLFAMAVCGSSCVSVDDPASGVAVVATSTYFAYSYASFVSFVLRTWPATETEGLSEGFSSDGSDGGFLTFNVTGFGWS